MPPLAMDPGGGEAFTACSVVVDVAESKGGVDRALVGGLLEVLNDLAAH